MSIVKIKKWTITVINVITWLIIVLFTNDGLSSEPSWRCGNANIPQRLVGKHSPSVHNIFHHRSNTSTWFFVFVYIPDHVQEILSVHDSRSVRSPIGSIEVRLIIWVRILKDKSTTPTPKNGQIHVKSECFQYFFRYYPFIYPILYTRILPFSYYLFCSFIIELIFLKRIIFIRYIKQLHTLKIYFLLKFIRYKLWAQKKN